MAEAPPPDVMRGGLLRRYENDFHGYERGIQMKVIATDKAPGAIGPYSQGYISNGFVYTSGQIPLNPETGAIEGQTIEAQAEQAIKNLGEILKAADSDFSKVVKTTCFLAHISDFAAFNSIYEKYFVSKPARSCFEVAALPKGALVEIEAVAVVE